jgi:LCP family protein required for cell wall assembly
VTDNPHGLVLPPELDPRRRRPAPRRSSGRLRRVLSVVAVVVSFSIVAASGVGYALYRYYDGRIPHLALPIDGDRPARVKGKALNFLLVGSDTRDGMTKEELRKAGTEFTPGRRSDTMILIHLSASREHVTLVSFPRDSYVEIPAHKGVAAHFGKINTAFSAGGPVLAIKTIERLTNVRVDHYIEVNFAGFQRLVDAVDGVDVCLPVAAREPLSGINLPAGRSRVKGTQALAFVRQRHGLPGGDLDRIKRQQQFMGALMQRATSLDVLLNPLRLKGFLDVASKSLQVDEDLEFGEMKSLALAMKGLDPRRVAFVTAPITGQDRKNGQSVVMLDEVAGRQLYRAIARDESLTKPPAAVPKKLTVPPAAIRVTVLNGTGIARRAAGAADELRTVGFRVAGTGNADRATYDKTVIRYAPGDEAAAATLAASLHGAKTEATGTGDTLTVVVGHDHQKPVAVKVAGSAAPRPPVSATRAPVKTAADDPCAA